MHRNIVAVVPAIFVLATAAPAPLRAQTDDPGSTRALWVSGAFGRALVDPAHSPGSATGGHYYAASVDLTVRKGRNLLQVRAHLWPSGGGEALGELGVLCGRAGRAGAFTVSAAVGLGGISMPWPDDRWRPGIPVMLRATTRSLSAVGLGAQLAADLNTQRSVMAVQLVVELGKRR